jgi:hypothetical protein
VPDALKEYQMEHGSQEKEMSHDCNPDGFWRTTTPEGTQILTMANDGNCFFRSISDQLDHDHGAGHKYICYQIINHICRNGDKFKDILLMQDNDKEITNLDSYLHKMRQIGEWGRPLEVYVASWFYKVDITIYSKEYVGTGGLLIFKADNTNGDSKKASPNVAHIVPRE